MTHKTLNKLEINNEAMIIEINADKDIKRRLQDLGFIKGSKVVAALRSPLGDPTAFRVKGTLIALRAEESSKIIIK